MKFKCLSVFVLMISFIGCQQQPEQKVQVAGALRNIMINGDISSKIEIESLQNKQHLYALGALANLKGEIVIFDNSPFITSVKDGRLELDQTLNHQATLLVYTQQEDWRQLELPEGLESYKDLETFITELAKNNAAKVDQPFPFLIRGTVKSAQWHVIDWPEGDTEHTHAKHKASGLHGTIADETVEILGFYSDKHHGVFTHHTTNMHLHVKNQTGNIAGHLDELSLGKGNTLSLPMN